MYRKITAAIAATIMLTSLLAAVGTVAAQDDWASITPQKVGDNMPWMFTLNIENPTSENISYVRIYNDTSLDTENAIGGANDKRDLKWMAKNFENFEKWFTQTGENLATASENYEKSAYDFENAGYAIAQPGGFEWDQEGVTDPAEINVCTSATDNIWSDFSAIRKEIIKDKENYTLISNHLTNIGENLKKISTATVASDLAADNFLEAGNAVNSLAAKLGNMTASVTALENVQGWFENIKENLSWQVSDAFGKAALEIEDVALKWESAENYMDNAGTALNNVTNLTSRSNSYATTDNEIESTGDNWTEHYEPNETHMWNPTNLEVTVTGDNSGAAEIRQSLTVPAQENVQDMVVEYDYILENENAGATHPTIKDNVYVFVVKPDGTKSIVYDNTHTSTEGVNENKENIIPVNGPGTYTLVFRTEMYINGSAGDNLIFTFDNAQLTINTQTGIYPLADRISNLNAQPVTDAESNLSDAASKLNKPSVSWASAGGKLYQAGENFGLLAEDLGKDLAGKEFAAAAKNLGQAGDNLLYLPSASDFVDFANVADKIKSSGTAFTTAASALDTGAGNLGPDGWNIYNVDTVGFTGIGDNNLEPGESADFTFLWSIGNTDNIDTYDLEVRLYKSTGTGGTWETRTMVPLTVDGEDPSIKMKVTQENVGKKNLINSGTATLTITASEMLKNIENISFTDKDNVLPPVGMDDLTTEDNKVFTYEFIADNWDENSPINVSVSKATDMWGNDNTDTMTQTFTVDTIAPSFMDNGLVDLTSAMVQKTNAAGTTFKNVDNTSDRLFSGYVRDNQGYENVPGYKNVTVKVMADGTSYDTLFNYPDNENMFFVEGGITLPEGLNTVTVKATDLTGNSTSDSVENVLIDSTSPTISASSISGSSYSENMWLTDNTPSISLSITDPNFPESLGVAGEDVLVSLWEGDGDAVTMVENSNVWDPSEGTFENTALENNGQPLIDGTYRIGVWAYDNYNDVTMENFWFRIDATTPTFTTEDLAGNISVKVGEQDVSTTTDETSWTISGTAREPGSTINVYQSDAADAEPLATVELGSDEREWSTEVSDLADGDHNIYIEEVDIAGNSSGKVLFDTYTVDTTAPTITLSSETKELDGSETSNSSVEITATIEDEVTAVKDLNARITAPAYDAPNADVTIADDGTLTMTVPLRAGQNTIQIIAEDGVNNTAIKPISVKRTVTPWTMYATIAAIIAIILAAIAILRRS